MNRDKIRETKRLTLLGSVTARLVLLVCVAAPVSVPLAVSATALPAAPQRPDCPDAGPGPEALCACLLQQALAETGSPPDTDLTDLECTVEPYEEGAVVVGVGGYELRQISYTLALRTGELWTPVARIGDKAIQGTGGHYSDFEIESVRAIDRGAGRLLWVQSRSSDGYWHFDGSEGTFETVEVTLCRLSEGPDQAPSCPLQAPIRITGEWSDPRDPAESPPDDDEDALEQDGREHRETTRLEIRISADGGTAEVLLLEGESKGALREKLGVHSLVSE